MTNTLTRQAAQSNPDPRRFFDKAVALLMVKYPTTPTPVCVGYSYGIAGKVWQAKDFSIDILFTEDVESTFAYAWRKTKAETVLYGRFLRKAPYIDVSLVEELVLLWQQRLAAQQPAQAA